VDHDDYCTALAEIPDDVREALLHGRVTAIEARLRELPGVMIGRETERVCPVEHRFEHGHYTRVARCIAGVLATTKTHRVAHPFFFAEGEASVLTDDGVQNLVAPCWGITKAGTKRVVFMHTDTVMVTVHRTEATDVDQAEAEIFVEDSEREKLCQG
jgi:hypothetical protein